ncbi:MAG: site-specific DNA-methyltransferase [Eubacteriaceae bacterium]
MNINTEFKPNNLITIYEGDCFDLLKKLPDESVDLIVTSPPYCIGKEYESPSDDIESFKNQHINLFSDIYRILKNGGSICWQVGYHVGKSSIIPLDYYIYNIFTEKSSSLKEPLILRNRIIWTFGHGLNSSLRFSGRHETILWFTKGNAYDFNLNSIRIPQKYPGKKSYKGPNKGNYSGNPLGKNPSDVWDIPNVKARHVEKTGHPCQFPVVIPQRLIKALTPKNGLVLDPFMGSGTSGVAAIIEGRRFAGSEIKKEYYEIAKERIAQAVSGEARIREDRPVAKPNLNMSVARMPEEFLKAKELKKDEEDYSRRTSEE